MNGRVRMDRRRTRCPWWYVVGVVAALLAGFPQVVVADEVRMLGSNAVREAYSELLPAFEKETGHHVSVEWGGTVDILRRAGAGENIDVVVVPAGGVDSLIARGIAVKRTYLAASAIGVAVRLDLPRPTIATAEDLSRALRDCRTIIISSGPSSAHMRVVFERLGVAGEVEGKILQLAPGLSVGEALAEGRGDIGFTQISELLPIKGISYVGPLPAEIQSITVFSAGLLKPSASSEPARALIAFLSGPNASVVLKKHGLEPGSL